MMKLGKRAVTILEIVIASVIISITVIGLSGIFVSGKRWINHARMRMTGGELGKLFLSPLQNAVVQWGTTSDNGWNQVNNELYPTLGSPRYCDSGSPQQPNCPSADERTMSGVTYSASYAISRLNPADSYSITRVVATITWTEP
jgi:hypothetical protein